MTDAGGELVTMTEAARLRGCHPTTLWRAVAFHRIPVFADSADRRRRLVRRADALAVPVADRGQAKRAAAATGAVA